MTLVFINWGNYDGFKAVLACARARADCPIKVIVNPDIEIQNELEKQVGSWCSYSLARWFVLRELALKQPDIFPVFCSDWDVMIFRNLADAYAPFNDFDYTVSINGGGSSAAYGVNNFSALDAFCNLVKDWLNAGNIAGMNDMEAWARLTRTGRFKVGNLFEIKNGSVFDHNIVCGSDRFKMDGQSKKVMFGDYNPYFVANDGTWILANTIHCWGPYKSKPFELLKHSGISL